ncbi:dienelactone hydrolase family protein [Micromonospora sp. CPCC 205371]|nr:dienelactone hydrolase family protein [Micromonospora sp. CPCC 205371]
MTARRGLLAALLLCLLAACGETRDEPETATTVTLTVDDRPFRLYVPGGYDPDRAAPLVVVLHGFETDAAMQENYFKLTPEAERRGFLYAMPEGTKNQAGDRFWNAADACCDFDRSGVDDSGYLRKLIDAVTRTYSVDDRRVYVIGFSNGGYMAHRMACEHSSEITAIVSLAGAATNDPSRCTPRRAVSVLQIHGTADRIVRYHGGQNTTGSYPSVADTVGLWRRLNGCTEQTDTSAAPIDLDSGLPGAETAVTAYSTGCRDGTRVELWSIKDGGHIPELTDGFAPAVVDFMLARVAPA